MRRTGPWHAGELLAFDLETTGTDPHADVPVSFAFVGMVDGEVAARQSSLVDPGCPIPPSATAVHGITDDRARTEGMALSDAVARMVQVLLGASRRGVPVVGMKVDFDLTMVDACHRRSEGWGLDDAGFTGPVLDALILDRHFDRFRRGRRSLSDLCAHYDVVIEHAHDAAADAQATLGVVAAMCRRYPELCAMSPEGLHRSQMDWHREWTDSFSEWRLLRGLLPLDPRARQWPIARPSDDVPAARAVG
jgi:DNA polymerase III subunit epsilon